MIGLQLYTLGDEWVKDTAGVFTTLAGMGIRDLELPGLWGKDPEGLRREADRAGVAFSSYHLPVVPFPDPSAVSLQSSPSEVAGLLGKLGIANAVVPLPPLPEGFRFAPGSTKPADLAAAIQSAGGDAWKRFAQMLNEKARGLAAHGITLGYHNHNVEFATIGRTTGWDILVAETEPELVHFELDLGWVAAAGLDPAVLLRQLGKRARWVHVKDLRKTTEPNHALAMDPAVVGEGKMDWPRVLRAARLAGVQHYYIEQEPPFAIPRMEAVERSQHFLSRLAVS